MKVDHYNGLARWAEYPAKFDVTRSYTPGASNNEMDTLSRTPHVHSSPSAKLFPDLNAICSRLLRVLAPMSSVPSILKRRARAYSKNPGKGGVLTIPDMSVSDYTGADIE